MSQAFTAKVHQFNTAPRRITLKGDKAKKTEPAQHIIEFPGGAIEVSRTSNGCYWAHVIVNQGQVVGDTTGLQASLGAIVNTRIDRDSGIEELADCTTIQQIAVLIKTN